MLWDADPVKLPALLANVTWVSGDCGWPLEPLRPYSTLNPVQVDVASTVIENELKLTGLPWLSMTGELGETVMLFTLHVGPDEVELVVAETTFEGTDVWVPATAKTSK